MKVYIYLFPYILSAIVSITVGIYCWRKRQVKGAAMYALAVFAQTSWTIGYIFELLAPDIETKIFWDNFQFIGGAVWLTAFLAFTMQFTDNQDRLPKFVYTLVSIPGALVVLLAFTNQIHSLMRTNARLISGDPFDALIYDFTYSILLWGSYSYLVIIVCAIVLFLRIKQTYSLYRLQVGLVLLWVFIPVAGTVVTITLLSQFPYRDITPFTTILSNIIIAWALFRYRLFDVVPMAREKVIDSIQDHVVVIDHEDRIVDINPAAIKASGLENVSVIGRPAEEIFAAWKDLIENYRNVQHVQTEIEIPGENGVMYFDLRIHPLYEKQGKLKGRVFVTRNITDVKKAEIELKKHRDHLEELVKERARELLETNEKLKKQIQERERLEEQLRQSQKIEAIGLLAGGIAHDFNNLLTAILGNVEFGLRKLEPKHKARKYLDNIYQVALRASDLTKHLLSFGRRQPLDVKVVDINHIIRDMLNMLKRVLGEDITLKTELFKGQALTMADAGQIHQVLLNLCTNARDAMPRGGKLSIITKQITSDEIKAKIHDPQPVDYFMVSISDTGIGMDEKVKSHIFEPFFTTKEAGKGTGLGMSVVHGIIEQHKAHILVFSVPGKGTTFEIYFPLEKGKSTTQNSKKAIIVKGGDETILIIEDDDMVRDVSVQLLTELGYHIHVTRDAREALELFEKKKEEINLVLSDVVMPGMSGPEIFSWINSIKPDLPVLFVTGYDIGQKLDEIKIIPNQDQIAVLQKPFTKETLGPKIRELLDKNLNK